MILRNMNCGSLNSVEVRSPSAYFRHSGRLELTASRIRFLIFRCGSPGTTESTEHSVRFPRFAPFRFGFLIKLQLFLHRPIAFDYPLLQPLSVEVLSKVRLLESVLSPILSIFQCLFVL